MIGALFRVVAGFVLAALTAGLAFVLFAVPPTEIASARGPGVGTVLDWALKSGTQAAIFSAPFALIAAAIGEWQRLRSPGYYIVAGLLIAAAGFLAQHTSETAGQQTVLNDYAIKAFLTAGFFSGLVYWLIAGRVAGEPEPDVVRAGAPRPAAKPSEKPQNAQPQSATPAASKVEDLKTAAAKAVSDTAGKAKAAVLDEVRPVVKDPEGKA